MEIGMYYGLISGYPATVAVEIYRGLISG